MINRRNAPVVAVDIGNSTVQVGLFVDGSNMPDGVLVLSARKPDYTKLTSILPEIPCLWYVASVVRQVAIDLESWCASNRPSDSYHTLRYHDLPLEIALERPDLVGMDRLAVAVAANQLRDASVPALVVDAGSAITVDVVSAEGAFLGGAILPGMTISCHGLSNSTDLLPLVPLELGVAPAAIGDETNAAIRSGVFWGTIGATKELIFRTTSQLRSKQPPQVFATGGDMLHIAPFLGAEVSYCPHLALDGILVAARALSADTR